FLGLLDITGVVQFWHLLAIGVVNGSLMAINMPSRQAIISEVVPENKIMNAVSLNNSGMNLTRILGPAVAGILIIFIETSGVFFLIAGIYVLSVLSMMAIKAGGAPAAKSRKSVVGDIKEGLSYTSADPTLRGLVIMAFIPSLFGFTYFALMPAWAREALNVQSDDLGYLLTVMGAGALVGTMILASVRNFSRRGMLLLMAALVWGMGMATFSQMTSFAGALPFLFLVGLLSSVYMSLNMTLLQIYASREMRGRVMSLSMMTFGVMPLSAVPFGYVAEHIGTGDALFISALMFIGATIIFGLAYPKFRRIA
ncbi:MAG: MFS transporter, partial [Chloroflexi bacterium]|nr:MFS transporter [Chloroflexota bacterium]